MKEAVTLVEGLTNVQAISLLKQLYRDLYKAVPYQHVKDHLLTSVDGVEMLRDVDLDTRKQYLDSTTSVKTTRHLLMAFARDDNLGSVLIQSWQKIKSDDSLFIEEAITVGLLVNLTLFMTSTNVEYKDRKLSFRYNPDVRILETILSPITELIKRFRR